MTDLEALARRCEAATIVIDDAPILAAAQAMAADQFRNHVPPVRWPARADDCLSGRDGTVPLDWDYAQKLLRMASLALTAAALRAQEKNR